MTWLALKLVSKKTWTFIKHYWYVPFFLIIGLIYIIWVGKDAENKAFGVLKAAEDSYKKQIETINEAHTKEIEKRNKILKKYQETISRLEKEYEKENKKITRKEKETVKKLAKKYHEDPESYTKEIANYFGFEYVESS